MKNYYFIFFLVLFVSCQSEKKHKEHPKQTIDLKKLVNEKAEIEDCDGKGIINNSDSYTCFKYKDSTVYNYQKYIVIRQQHNEYNGDVVTITNKKTNSYFKVGVEESCFFKGIYKNYILIDEGTSQIRILKIYDINKSALIFTTSYVGDLTLRKGTLLFNTKVEIVDESKIPECSKELQEMEYGIGYVEDLIYSFEKNALTRTGHYECCYFE
jgi:glutamine cyclotransferase